ncbi:unnamed protein product [Gadus morhua 'NCC']
MYFLHLISSFSVDIVASNHDLSLSPSDSLSLSLSLSVAPSLSPSLSLSLSLCLDVLSISSGVASAAALIYSYFLSMSDTIFLWHNCIKINIQYIPYSPAPLLEERSQPSHL